MEDANALLHQFIDLIQMKNTFQQQSSGVAPQDMYVLERIHFQNSSQIRDLSRKYSIPPSTLTGILDRLEKKQYIRRERKTDDRRAVILAVTDQGRAVLKRHLYEDSLFSANLFDSLSDEKKEQFLVLFHELLHAVDKEHLFDSRNSDMRGGNHGAN